MKVKDEIVNFARGSIWTTIHLGMAIICACLPTYRPLLTKCEARLASLRGRYSSKLRSGIWSKKFQRNESTSESDGSCEQRIATD